MEVAVVFTRMNNNKHSRWIIVTVMVMTMVMVTVRVIATVTVTVTVTAARSSNSDKVTIIVRPPHDFSQDEGTD